MQLVEVTNSSLAKEFLLVNVELNKNNPAYIRPLDKDINEVFDKKKNKTFRSGEVTRWILKDEEGKFLGRIAAFTNKKYKNKGDDVPIGGIGFFDCINDQVAADMLFNVAKHWLMQKGMQAMDGSGDLSIILAPDNAGQRARIEVSDSGHGIAPEHLHRVYDPFFTTKAARKGTGLGLSVTYGIIQEHGGSIEVSNRRGGGACFRVELPLAVPGSARKPVTAA